MWTPDLQLTLVWGNGGLGPSEVELDVQPLDPVGLGPLPRGIEPNGNAYRIERSPGTAIGEGRVFLTVPTPPTAMYFSADGHAWRPLPPTNAEDGVAAGAIESEGYVLAGSSHDDDAKPSRLGPVVLGAVATGMLILAQWSWRRRRLNASASASPSVSAASSGDSTDERQERRPPEATSAKRRTPRGRPR